MESNQNFAYVHHINITRFPVAFERMDQSDRTDKRDPSVRMLPFKELTLVNGDDSIIESSSVIS